MDQYPAASPSLTNPAAAGRGELYAAIPTDGAPTVRHIVADRRALFHHVSSALQHCQDTGRHGAVICVGIDRFDRLRRVYGLFAADALVHALANRIQPLLDDGDAVIHLGADEFLILPARKDADRGHIDGFARHLTNRLAGLAEQPFDCDGTLLTPSLTVGSLCYPAADEGVEGLIHRAINTLSQARFFPAGPDSATQGRMDFLNQCCEIEQALYSALPNHELSLHYQPIVDIGKGEVIGAEVLLRWLHPTFGQIAPDLFIPVAEDTGQIIAIGDWVLHQLGQQLGKWRAMGVNPDRFSFAVNISPRQFMAGDFVAKILHFLDNSPLKPANLHLEITENIAMADVDATAARVHQLNALGIRCAIDDFGTGYSSLTYLRQLPCGALKIDRSFIKDFMTNLYSRAIVESTINLARAVGLEVVAEGVEHGDQYIELKRLGCHYYQGYFFSPAIPAEEFAVLLA